MEHGAEAVVHEDADSIAASISNAVLVDGSLLAAITASPELTACVLAQLGGAAMACLLMTSASVGEQVRQQIPALLRDHRLPPDTTLCTLDRVDSALFHEHFWGEHFWRRWQRGPSQPPTGRVAYYFLGQMDDAEVVVPEKGAGPADGVIDQASSALVAGARALLCDEGADAEGATSRGELVVLLGELEGKWLVMSVQPPWSSSSPRIVDAHSLTPLSGFSAGARERPPRRSLRLHGGWRMNFSGAFYEFQAPIQPTRISFAFQLRTPCPGRAFFNVFFSSATERYSDEAVFYAGTSATLPARVLPTCPFPHAVCPLPIPHAPSPAGNSHHHPQPSDVFSVLFDVSKADPPHSASHSMVWLPSGHNLHLTLPHSEAAAGDGGGYGGHECTLAWHRVVLELSWADMRLHAFVGGERAAGPPNGTYFGPHLALIARARQGQPAARRTVRSLMRGFTRLFLFTWLDGALNGAVAEEAPDVRIADLWIDGSGDGGGSDHSRGIGGSAASAMSGSGGEEEEEEEEEVAVRRAWQLAPRGQALFGQDSDEESTEGSDTSDDEEEDEGDSGNGGGSGAFVAPDPPQPET